MSQRGFPSNSTELASKVAEVLSQGHRFAYAQISPDLRIVYSSSDFREFLPDHPPVLTNQLLTEVLWEFVGAEAALHEVLRGESALFGLNQINRMTTDGSISYFNFRVLPLDALNPGKGLLLIIEDVTHASQLEQHLVQDRNELRLLQAQLARANAELIRLNQLKSLLLSIAAHDLRAPLSAIRGYAELLLLDTDADNANVPIEQQKDIETIFSLVEQLDHLIVDLLDLDQIERGTLSIQPTQCDLSAEVGKMAARMGGLMVYKDLILIQKMLQAPNWVMADPNRLEQVLYNLISNAIKYSHQGGEIHLVSGVNSQGGFIQVGDNGPGIPLEELPHVFELYYRTDEARRSQSQGSGLGLYIVKYLIEAMDGEVDVASEINRGTTFTITLPSVD